MQLLHSIRIRLAQLLAPSGHVVVPQVIIRGADSAVGRPPSLFTTARGNTYLMIPGDITNVTFDSGGISGRRAGG